MLLDNVLMESSSLLEFDVSVKTGKALMLLRKNLMSFLGWTEMPATAALQQVPVVVLSKLQERFLPEGKQAMFVKLVQAFHSAVQDIRVILDEMLALGPSNDELLKWKAREPELQTLLRDSEKLLAEHREVLALSLSKEDEFGQVQELGEMLQPELESILKKLAAYTLALENDTQGDIVAFYVMVSKAKNLLELGEEGTVDSGGANKAAAQAVVVLLSGKLASVSEVLRSVTTTSKGLLTLVARARQINALLK